MGRHTENPDVSSEVSSETVPHEVLSLTRRQLRDLEAGRAASEDSPALPPRSAGHQASSPRRARRRSTGPVTATALKNSSPKNRSAEVRTSSARAKAPHKKSGWAAKLITMTAMGFVAAIAVATSVPANALLSSQDVETLQNQQQVKTAVAGQSVEASGESVAAGRDGVSVSAAPVKAYTSSSSQKVLTFVPNSTGPILWPFPVSVPLTDGFGPRVGIWTYGGYTGNFHSGLDFDPGAGTPIQAIADGIVSEVSSSLCGTAVVIDHNVNGERFQSQYCHMVYGSPTVSAGDSIKAGGFVGNVGSTGMSTGPHLHLEIHLEGNAVDPYVFLQARTS